MKFVLGEAAAVLCSEAGWILLLRFVRVGGPHKLLPLLHGILSIVAQQKHAALTASEVPHQLFEKRLLLVLVEEVHSLFFEELSLDEVLDGEAGCFDLGDDLLDCFDVQASVGLDEADGKWEVLLLWVEEQVLALKEAGGCHWGELHLFWRELDRNYKVVRYACNQVRRMV